MKHMSANAIPFNPTSLHDSEDGCVPLLTVVEAAEFLKLSPGSLYHLVFEKRVPVIRISSCCIRFSRRALLEWVESLTQKIEQFPGE